MGHHTCVVSFYLFKINLHLSYFTADPYLYSFDSVKSHCSQEHLFRHEKSSKFLSNFENYLVIFPSQSLRRVFAQISDVIGSSILRVFLQEAFPYPYFRDHSPQEVNHRCDVGILLLFGFGFFSSKSEMNSQCHWSSQFYLQICKTITKITTVT